MRVINKKELREYMNNEDRGVNYELLRKLILTPHYNYLEFTFEQVAWLTDANVLQYALQCGTPNDIMDDLYKLWKERF